MFKRFGTGFGLDFLDNKIAEEQEKQKQQQQSQKGGSPARRPSNRPRRGSGRIDPPGARSGSRLRVPDSRDGVPLTKGPDPEEFVIGDDDSVSSISRTATPQPSGSEDKSEAAEKGQTEGKEGDAQDGDKGKSKATDDELPEHVQKKLAHLEKLTARYQDLLRNYRTAHARVSLIDPFEATLREHTPLTSIEEPGALVEFLNQRSLQSDMVLEELKKVAGQKNELTKERDELKSKLEEAEKKVKQAFDDAAGLRKERDEAKPATSTVGAEKKEDPKPKDAGDDDAFFSYEDEVSRDDELKAQLQNKDTLLKQKDEEIQTFQAKEKEQTEFINELSTENASLRKDVETVKNELEVKNVDLDAANKHIERKDNEIASIKQELTEVIAARDAAKQQEDAVAESLVQTESQLVSMQQKLNESQEALRMKAVEAEARKSEAEANLKKYQAEHAKNLKEGTYAQRDVKVLENVRSILPNLQAELKKKTEEANIAEARVADMQKDLKIMEAQAAQTESTTKYLRDVERTAKEDKRKLHELEQQRDALQKIVDSKKAHEQKVASLQVELKQARADRDKAYYAIINCGKCETPEQTAEKAAAKSAEVATPTEETASTATRSRLGSETTELSTQPTEPGSESANAGTPPIAEDDDKQVPTGSAKKKNKKKSKKKPKKTETDGETATAAETSEQSTVGVTVEDLIRDREAASAKLKHKFAGNPIIPLLEDMHEYVRNRTEAVSDSHDSHIAHLEERIERSEQEIKNKMVIIRDREDQIDMLKSSLSNQTYAKSEAVFEEEIERLTKEMEALKEERDAKSIKLLGLEQARLEAGEAALKDDSTSWQDRADELQVRIDALEQELAEKNDRISKLTVDLSETGERLGKAEEKIKSQIANEELIESLKEEKEELQDSMLEHGKAATDAKHELKEVKEKRDTLQKELDETELESAKREKQLKEAEKREKDLQARLTEVEAELTAAKSTGASSEELQAANEQVESLKREKESLQVAKDAGEAQLEELKAQHAASGTERNAKQQAVVDELEKLKSRAAELEKDLAASENLAQQRFKDLTSTKELNNQFQVQLKKLKQESDELRSVKAELEKSNALVKKVEGKAKDLRSEIAEYKSQAADKDTELAVLRGKVKTGEDRGKALEESYETARKDLEKTQNARDEAIDAKEKLEASYKKLEDDLRKQKPRLDELEKQVQKLSAENNNLREELQTKATLQASADSYVQSVQDQSRELATRSKEMQERVESLEEELADTQRSLLERSREGDTMKRLLADAESRAEAKVKELREQRDLAIEERDRAEADASTVGRKKAREIEELKTKLREVEYEASRASEARKDAEKREQDFKSSRAELERRLAQAQEDAEAARTAMTQLQNSLDEGDRQVSNLEKERHDLKKQLEEREARLERLQKSSRTMAEELQQLKNSAKLRQQPQTGSGSSRTSLESAGRSRITSPAPRPSTSNSTNLSGAPSDINYVYLRQVLLQFLEQKDKKFQLQLVPVLGRLLHFDQAEEQKWTAAIAAK
ncbi:Myosin-10 [Cercospora beticola]|uniref:Myosin-10 n=1 Tax=Cercospora beticola TaxID=122368 RepID=A0A2G5HYD4_CERBT|nr:Myosin-10 [Cercospora beticola]PIA97538.1 Myosin-10 [Cercospora beticola]WPA99011.1 hypothetical protein RHO25_003625 [Cercospora beticola]CAK1360317.1 unnamed protein product [Cercospora beticola]